MLTIAVAPSPNQTFRCVLGWQPCVASLRQRGSRMYLDLAAGDRPIVRGAICQNGADVIQGAEPWFGGTLHFWDWEGDEPPRWDGLGSRWKLYYVPPGETLPEVLRW